MSALDAHDVGQMKKRQGASRILVAEDSRGLNGHGELALGLCKTLVVRRHFPRLLGKPPLLVGCPYTEVPRSQASRRGQADEQGYPGGLHRGTSLSDRWCGNLCWLERHSRPDSFHPDEVPKAKSLSTPSRTTDLPFAAPSRQVDNLVLNRVLLSSRRVEIEDAQAKMSSQGNVLGLANVETFGLERGEAGTAS